MIERALNPDPAIRFKSALDFVDTFERNVRHGLTDAAGRAQHEEQLRRWRESKNKSESMQKRASRMEAVENARHEIHDAQGKKQSKPFSKISPRQTYPQ